MPPAKRDLSKMMWLWGGGAVVMFVACMVIANFFFPTTEESGYLEALVREPQTTTYFHAGDPPAIRAWKWCFLVAGVCVALLMVTAFIQGLLYASPSGSLTDQNTDSVDNLPPDS